MKKVFLLRPGFLGVLGLLGLAALADTVDGVIVTAGGATGSFAITDVKEITFSDTGVTVVPTEGSPTIFEGDWLLTFGQVESALASVEIDTDAPAEVYNLEGVLLMSVPSLRTAPLAGLPGGVYIVKCNGKCLKIKL